MSRLCFVVQKDNLLWVIWHTMSAAESKEGREHNHKWIQVHSTEKHAIHSWILKHSDGIFDSYWVTYSVVITTDELVMTD